MRRLELVDDCQNGFPDHLVGGICPRSEACLRAREPRRRIECLARPRKPCSARALETQKPAQRVSLGAGVNNNARGGLSECRILSQHALKSSHTGCILLSPTATKCAARARTLIAGSGGARDARE